ncbi:hypothetical protein NBRGN_029_00250 [Nocardia brasiliensis NBRC 14402]|nr:hypothetical protein NBRGN_029_00250 [Nocardia brasiliensis NBRC 14402]SUB40147.1 Uncharacterised protein [Nocardia brasiliensis]
MRTSFHGSLETSDPEIVEQVLRAWLSTDTLRMRPRRGWETYYEADGFELLCYEAESPSSPDYFLLEGHIDGSVEAAVHRLHQLVEQCRQANIGFAIDYEEVDDDGNPVSAEKTIS